MIYTVLKIEEDLDYGCEDRRDDQPVMAVVTLRSEEGKECTRKIPDQLLYEREIAQGDEVIFDDNDQIRKKLGKDWTEHCSSKNTNTQEFAGWLQAARTGENIQKVCPFCGGNVGILSNIEGRTLIGCDSCDMHIELDITGDIDI